MKRFSHLASALFMLFSVPAFGQSTPQLAADICTGSCDSDPISLTTFANKLYFYAYNSSTGTKLTQFDGAAANTVLTTGSAGQQFWGREMYPLPVAGGKLFFLNQLSFNSGLKFYSTTGTGTPTEVLVNGQYPNIPDWAASYNNKLYYLEGSANAGELKVFDPANNTISTLLNLSQIYFQSYPFFKFVVMNNRMYFLADSWAALGYQQLFYYDFASNSLTAVPSNNPFQFSSELVAVGNRLYWTASDPSNNYENEIFGYQGSGNTSRITSLNGSNDGVSTLDAPGELVAYNGALYFSGNNGVAGYELMRLDPATNATTLVSNIASSSQSSFPTYMSAINGKLYFAADNIANGIELWMHDGTNTTMVADINPGAGDSDPKEFTLFNNAIYFAANEGPSGQELFRMTATNGIEKVNTSLPFSIAPNPAKDFIRIIPDASASAYRVNVTDVTGRAAGPALSVSSAAGQAISLLVGELVPGIYFLHFTDQATGVALGQARFVKD